MGGNEFGSLISVLVFDAYDHRSFDKYWGNSGRIKEKVLEKGERRGERHMLAGMQTETKIE